MTLLRKQLFNFTYTTIRICIDSLRVKRDRLRMLCLCLLCALLTLAINVSAFTCFVDIHRKVALVPPRIEQKRLIFVVH